MTNSTEHLRLADVLAGLRGEIDLAAGMGANEDTRFKVLNARVELAVEISREGGGKTGFNFWVVEAGVEASLGRTVTHTVAIDLEVVSARTGRSPEVRDRARA